MAVESGTDEATCGICGDGTLEEMLDYRSLRRVTSDCRPWPAGGRLGACRTCGAVQKPANDTFLAEIDAIYRSYTIYHQAAGAEQAVFEQTSGLPASRSVKLLETFRRHAGLNAGLLLQESAHDASLQTELYHWLPPRIPKRSDHRTIVHRERSVHASATDSRAAHTVVHHA